MFDAYYTFYNNNTLNRFLELYVSDIERLSRENNLKDQDMDVICIHWKPRDISFKPLLLIGGMGALAGTDGFRKALKTEPNREIILYQLTKVADRTSGILEDIKTGGTSVTHRKIVGALQKGIKDIYSILDSNKEYYVVLLCNTAHYFIGEVEFPENFRFISLLDSAVDFIKRNKIKCVLCLFTTGTNLSRIYIKRLEDYNIDFITPVQDDQEKLMDLIYNGVKANNKNILDISKNILCNIIKKYQPADGILCGCTEIPILIRRIDCVNNIKIIDPVEIAIKETIKMQEGFS